MIARLLHYPVKSMRGEDLEQTRVTTRGLEGDRRWAVIDKQTGHVVSAKYPRRWGPMLMFAARLGGHDRILIRFSDGQEYSAGTAACDRVLSEYLGRQVRLSDTPPPNASIERTDPVIDREEGAGPSTLPTRTGRLGACVNGPSFFDYAPIHLLTTATLQHLNTLAPGSCFDPARFRPNLVLDLPDAEPFAENQWAGRVFRVGSEVMLRILTPSPRCSIPTLPQPGLPLDHGIIKTIAGHNRISLDGGDLRACVGAYATVVIPGNLRVGDVVEAVAPSGDV